MEEELKLKKEILKQILKKSRIKIKELENILEENYALNKEAAYAEELHKLKTITEDILENL